MTRSVEWGLREALGNAGRVMASGLLAFLLYWGFITVGPGLDGWANPVISDYRIEGVRSLQNGAGFSFRASFVKRRDCTYYGVTWFGMDNAGNLTRIQLGRSDAGPPLTGPTGKRMGDRLTLYPPHGTTSIFGLNQHDCGWPWQTRTIVGPFTLDHGKPEAP